jgi:tetratricopeptide (TPR) repeat protein
MKSIFSALFLVALALAVTSPEATAQQSTPANAPSAEGQKMMADFMKLPEQQRIDFNKNVRLAQKLYREKRIFDALQVIGELEKIQKNHPACLSLKAGCYVEMRAFDKAYVIFEKLHKLSPKSTNILFNLAELEFVTKKWQKAHKRFTELLTLLPQNAKSLRHLSEFKLLLCNLKTNRVKEARSMQNKYGEWDDTPYYYYARAAILYHDGNEEAAKKILREALFIWREPAALSSWQDTMIEFGYVRSFYGESSDDKGIVSPTNNDAAPSELAPDTPRIAPVIPLDTE